MNIQKKQYSFRHLKSGVYTIGANDERKDSDTSSSSSFREVLHSKIGIWIFNVSITLSLDII